MLSVFLGETRISLGSLDFLLALAMRESNHTYYFLVSQPKGGARSRDQGAFCMAFAAVFKAGIDASFHDFLYDSTNLTFNIDRELGKTENRVLEYPIGLPQRYSSEGIARQTVPVAPFVRAPQYVDREGPWSTCCLLPLVIWSKSAKVRGPTPKMHRMR